MILTATEIQREAETGGLVLDPFDTGLLNPNSYNYRLGSTILESRTPVLDPKDAAQNLWLTRIVPDEGLLLAPNRFYLGTTLERIGSARFVPLLIGRSSLGRLGLFLQISADLGHLGAVHQWTLELVAVQPIRVYPGMRIGQVSFWIPEGDIRDYDGYFGRQNQPTVTPEGYNLARGVDGE